MNENGQTPKKDIEIARALTREKRLDAMLYKDVHSSAVILTRDRRAVSIRHKNGSARHATGRYEAEAQAMYWVPRPIKRGWHSFHIEGDPEPISEREPVGYGAKMWDHLVGGKLTNIVLGGMRDKVGFEVKSWMIIAGILAVVGTIGYLAAEGMI